MEKMNNMNSVAKLLSLGVVLSCFSISGVLGQEETEVKPDGPWISSLAWSGDKELLGTSSQGLLLRPATVVKASVDALDDLTKLGESETSLWTITLLEDGKVVATDYKGGVHVWSDGESTKIDQELRWIRAVKDVGDGKLLAGTEDGKLVEISVADGKVTRTIEDVHAAAVFDIAVSESGKQVATCGGDGSVKVFSWPELKELGSMSNGSDALWSVLFVNDDQQIVTGGAGRRIQLWDVKTASSVCTITRTKDWVTDMVALPDSTLVVAACMDGNLVVADFATLSRVESVKAAESAIWCAALHSSGSMIAIGTRKDGFGLIEVDYWAAKAEKQAEELAKIRPPSPKKN